MDDVNQNVLQFRERGFRGALVKQDPVMLKRELLVMEAYIPQYMSGNHLGSCKLSPVYVDF